MLESIWRKGNPPITVGGNVSWCRHCGKQNGDFSNKTKQNKTKHLNIELPYDPAIPFLGIFPDKTIIQKDTCIPMLIAALLTISKTWKQPKCPSTEEEMKMWYTYTME